jgi:hypothetical protein
MKEDQVTLAVLLSDRHPEAATMRAAARDGALRAAQAAAA